MTHVDPIKVAIIGGGITGLACAHRFVELNQQTIDNPARRQFEITLLEAGSRWGGVVGTHSENGYLIEQGADNFLTDKPWGVDLCRRLGLEDRLIPTDERYRGSLVIRKGRPVAVPEGFVLMAPSKLGPILMTPIFSPWGKLRMVCEYFLPRRHGDDDESVARFIRRRFGREVLDRLVQPLVGGIYTADPERLSISATLPRFVKMEQEHGSLIRAMRKQAQVKSARSKESGARYSLFVGLRNGMTELIDRLIDRIASHVTLRLNSSVTRLQRIHKEHETAKYTLTINNIQTASFDAVVLTVPAYRAADLVETFDKTLAGQLKSIDYASSIVVVTGHRRQDVSHPLDAFGLVVPACEKRRALAISFSSRKFPARAPEGEVLFRTFIGGALQPELCELDDAEIERITKQELRDLLGVSGEPTFARIIRYQRGMPQYNVGHEVLVAKIRNQLNKQLGLALAGNAYEGVGIPDCIHSGEEAAERLTRQFFV